MHRKGKEEKPPEKKSEKKSEPRPRKKQHESPSQQIPSQPPGDSKDTIVDSPKIWLPSPLINIDISEIQAYLSTSGLWEHRFVNLTEYSLLRACIQNAILLSLSPYLLFDEESLSPWTLLNPYSSPTPSDIKPTSTQLCTPHHPYLDLMTPPGFRDNILAAGLDDAVEDQLCFEIHVESFIVWGSQPWSAIGTFHSYQCFVANERTN